MPVSSVMELFVHELRDMYDAENELVDTLQTLVDTTTNDDLKTAFEEHRIQTQGHVRRLEKIFKELDTKPKAGGVQCTGIRGIVKERDALSKEKPTDEVLDIATVFGAQKVENYEITAYTGLISMARDLGKDEFVEPLEETLNEERDALHKLQSIAGDMSEGAKETIKITR